MQIELSTENGLGIFCMGYIIKNMSASHKKDFQELITFIDNKIEVLRGLKQNRYILEKIENLEKEKALLLEGE